VSGIERGVGGQGNPLLESVVIVLASQSASRAALLSGAGIPFAQVNSEVDESAVQAEMPTVLARMRARAKAAAVATSRPLSDLVVGADQVVFMGRLVFGKPATGAEHLAMLRAFRGNWHALVTAVTLWSCGKDAREIDRFEVRSRLALRSDLRDDELLAYVACGEGRGCAGGYRVEGRGICLFSEIRGDWTNILGLPMIHLVTRLRRIDPALVASVSGSTAAG
jgi:septum formation protein